MVAASGNGSSTNNQAANIVALLKIFGVIISAAIALITTYYTTREALEQEIRTSLEATRVQIRAEAHQDLSHYVSLEQFSDWRRDWETTRTTQYYKLLQAIDAVDHKIPRR